MKFIDAAPIAGTRRTADGYLVARSDFTVPVGPSFFERDSSKDFKDGDN